MKLFVISILSGIAGAAIGYAAVVLNAKRKRSPLQRDMHAFAKALGSRPLRNLQNI